MNIDQEEDFLVLAKTSFASAKKSINGNEYNKDSLSILQKAKQKVFEEQVKRKWNVSET